MTVVTFDTLAYANKLKKSGLDSEIAEAHAEATSEILQELVTNDLVSKYDLRIALKEQEERMKLFISKTVIFTVTFLGSIQTLFHLIK